MSGALRAPLGQLEMVGAYDRFMAFIEYEPNTGCHLWAGADRGLGYGIFWLEGRNVSAHRAAYVMYNGDIEDDRVVMHRCDTPACCNPAHLFLGSTAENQADKRIKGRAARGERNHRARLTREDVREIRRRCAAGESQRSVGRDFSMRQGAISSIVTRTAWGWLD